MHLYLASAFILDVFENHFSTSQEKYIKDNRMIIITTTTTTTSLDYETLNTRSKCNLCPYLLPEKKNTIPLERSKPPKLMLYVMKNIIFKLLIQVKILKGNSMLSDSNYM